MLLPGIGLILMFSQLAIVGHPLERGGREPVDNRVHREEAYIVHVQQKVRD